MLRIADLAKLSVCLLALRYWEMASIKAIIKVVAAATACEWADWGGALDLAEYRTKLVVVGRRQAVL